MLARVKRIRLKTFEKQKKNNMSIGCLMVLVIVIDICQIFWYNLLKKVEMFNNFFKPKKFNMVFLFKFHHMREFSMINFKINMKNLNFPLNSFN